VSITLTGTRVDAADGDAMRTGPDRRPSYRRRARRPVRPDPETTVTETDWTEQLVEQLDYHWRQQLRPRLAGLTDEEYFREPVAGCWNVRRRGTSTAPIQGGSGPFTIDFAYPEPTPPPVTTIAWRLGHLIVGVLGVRAAAHFSGPAVDYMTFGYAGTAATALGQLDDAYRAWIDGVRTLDEAALAQPCGPHEGEYAAYPMAALVLHINREVIHHGAEVAVLRDLYAHRGA
jgi:hypothetical protein